MTHSTCPPLARTAALAGFAALSSLFLAACGGDGNSTPPPPPPAITQVPASAAASDSALEMFAFNLAQNDTAEPLTLELVPTLPTSETEDPIATP